jgi:hypothetical protein
MVIEPQSTREAADLVKVDAVQEVEVVLQRKTLPERNLVGVFGDTLKHKNVVRLKTEIPKKLFCLKF